MASTTRSHTVFSFAENIAAEDDNLKAMYAAGMSQVTKRIDALSAAFTTLSQRRKSLDWRIHVAQNIISSTNKPLPGAVDNGKSKGTIVISTEYAMAMALVVAAEASAIGDAAEDMFLATKSRIDELREETNINVTLEYFWLEGVEEFARIEAEIVRFNDVVEKSRMWLGFVGDLVPPIAHLARLQL